MQEQLRKPSKNNTAHGVRTTAQQKVQLRNALQHAPLEPEGTIESDITTDSLIAYAEYCDMPTNVIKAIPRLVKTYGNLSVQYQLQRCFESCPTKPIAYLEASLKELIR